MIGKQIYVPQICHLKQHVSLEVVMWDRQNHQLKVFKPCFQDFDTSEVGFWIPSAQLEQKQVEVPSL